MPKETDYLRKQIVKARFREKIAILVIVLGSLLTLGGIYLELIVEKEAGGRYHPYIDQSIFILILGFLIIAIGGGVNTYYGWKRSQYMKQLTGMMRTSDQLLITDTNA